MKVEVSFTQRRAAYMRITSLHFWLTGLEQSTEMFGRLADPNGANNALSQVLYGLALR